jgi:acetoin utilization protein AcuC
MMTCNVAVPWDETLLAYDFGPGHPMAPVRIELTMALARQLDVLDQMDVTTFSAASDAELQLVHTKTYIAAVKSAGRTSRSYAAHGLGTDDDPVFPGMHEASALVVGASVAAARAVVSGSHDHAVNVTGGLHHAMPNHAAGFCIYNDPAIAIAWMLANGADRVAYVDIDVHHGDGVQAIFWNDPRVLTISLHESGETQFPGTGYPSEIGGPDALGSAVNVALPAGTGDTGWHQAFDEVVPLLLRSFAPSYLVTQHGCDTHALDPLADLVLTIDGQRTAHSKLHDLAHEVCRGRWVATGGGGYDIARVVPRSWTHLLAIASGEPVDPQTETPNDWRELVQRRTGATAPRRMSDDQPSRADDQEAIGRTIAATRAAVFAYHDLPA